MAQLQSTVVDGTLNSLRTENVKTSSHTLALADRDKVVVFNGSGAQTCTVPTDSVAFPIGSVVYIARLGSGEVTLQAAGGVTLTRSGTFGQYEEIYVRKRASNYWIVVDSPRTLTASSNVAPISSGGYLYHTFTSGSDTVTVS